jgi:transaldolase
MKFFIDTANLDQIREANALGILDGVTTNPSLMAKEGIKGTDNILKHYVDICNIVDGPVSAEVFSTDFEGMIREADILSNLHPNIVNWGMHVYHVIIISKFAGYENPGQSIGI